MNWDLRNTILISFFAHVLLAILFFLLPKYLTPPPSSAAPIEVSIIGEEDKTKQILNNDPLVDKLEKIEKQTKLLSDKTRRVIKETQAPPSPTMTRPQRGGQPKINLQGPDLDFKTADAEGTRAQRRAAKNELDLSSITNQNRSNLEDVDIGAINALNTDQDLYYSFYSRVNELLWIRWTSLIQMTEQTTPLARFQQTAQDHWTTIVDVLLKPSGHLKQVIVLKQSGFQAFDRDASRAFEDASYFPNPPPELVTEDGYIHLRYALTVITPKVLFP